MATSIQVATAAAAAVDRRRAEVAQGQSAVADVVAQLSSLAAGTVPTGSGALDTLDALTQSLRKATDPAKGPSSSAASGVTALGSPTSVPRASVSLKAVIGAYAEQSAAKAA